MQTKCPHCGATELTVERTVTYVKLYTTIIECGCGHAEDGVAATEEARVEETWMERGRLDEVGRFCVEEREHQDREVEHAKPEVHCQRCYDAYIEGVAAGYPANLPEDDVEDVSETDAYTASCSECGWRAAVAPDESSTAWEVQEERPDGKAGNHGDE